MFHDRHPGNYKNTMPFAMVSSLLFDLSHEAYTQVPYSSSVFSRTRPIPATRPTMCQLLHVNLGLLPPVESLLGVE